MRRSDHNSAVCRSTSARGVSGLLATRMDGAWCFPLYDGNATLIRTETGVWHVQYNAENRPVCYSNDTGRVIHKTYDYIGRMAERVESQDGQVFAHERYIYRGYLRIAALDMLNDAAAVHTVVWDPTEPAATRPLLLMVSNPANPVILAEYYTFGFDQAKNVTELFDSSGNIAAAYDHGPFGEDMASTGPAAALNPFRFSSEVWDATLGLVQYTFRPFNPLAGRFTTRDPIGEDGGLNLYGFVGNDPVNKIDALGLFGNPVCGPDGCYYPPDPCWGNCPLPKGISEPCASGFCVVGTTIDTCYGGFLQRLGIDHVDITYNGKVVFVGQGGALPRLGQQYFEVSHKYPLIKKETGTFQWGGKKDCPCKNATDGDILNCLGVARPPSGYNCQGSVQASVDGCCLSGFKTLVSTCFPTVR